MWRRQSVLIIKSVCLSGLISILLISTMLASSANAQLAANSLGIKITSPTRGQQVPANTNSLKINGISNHSDLLHCNVYVIVNGIKPYHKALSGAGNNNSSDYLTWVYYLVPSYTPIKIGTNKVTSKLACESNNSTAANGASTLAKFYSINFTGISSPGAKLNSASSPAYTNEKLAQPSPQTHPPAEVKTVKTNDTKPISQSAVRTSAGNVLNKNRTLEESQPTQLTKVDAATLLSTAGIVAKSQTSTHQNNTSGGGHSSSASSSIDKGKSQNNSVDQLSNNSEKPVSSPGFKGANSKSPLAMSIHMSQRVAQPGERENMTLGVTDGNKSHALAGATVFGRIVDPTGVSKKLEGVTDNKGKVRYSWLIAGNSNASGSYRVTLSASAPGYQNNSITKALKVVPVTAVSHTIHPIPIFGAQNNVFNSTNRPESMPLASANTSNSPQSGLQPHESMPLIPKQNVSTSLENINGKVNGRVYIPTALGEASTGSAPPATGKVTIPASTAPVNIASSLKVSVPTAQKIVNSSKVSVPTAQKNTSSSTPLTQEISPSQQPQLPNNNDKTPFIIATPILHITNGSSDSSSNHLNGIAAALDIVDRMRVMGAESFKTGTNEKVSTAPPTAGVTQKNTIFIPSSSQVNSN